MCIITWHGLYVVYLLVGAMLRPETGDGQQRKKLHAFFISSYLCYAEFGASGGTKNKKTYENKTINSYVLPHAGAVAKRDVG